MLEVLQSELSTLQPVNWRDLAGERLNPAANDLPIVIVVDASGLEPAPYRSVYGHGEHAPPVHDKSLHQALFCLRRWSMRPWCLSAIVPDVAGGAWSVCSCGFAAHPLRSGGVPERQHSSDIMTHGGLTSHHFIGEHANSTITLQVARSGCMRKHSHAMAFMW